MWVSRGIAVYSTGTYSLHIDFINETTDNKYIIILTNPPIFHKIVEWAYRVKY